MSKTAAATLRGLLACLLVSALSLSTPVLGQDSIKNDLRRGFLTGEIDHSELSALKKIALHEWLERRTSRMRYRLDLRRARAERQGEELDPLPDRKEIEDMTTKEMAKEVLWMFSLEVDEAEVEVEEALEEEEEVIESGDASDAEKRAAAAKVEEKETMVKALEEEEADAAKVVAVVDDADFDAVDEAVDGNVDVELDEDIEDSDDVVDVLTIDTADIDVDDTVVDKVEEDEEPDAQPVAVVGDDDDDDEAMPATVVGNDDDDDDDEEEVVPEVMPADEDGGAAVEADDADVAAVQPADEEDEEETDPESGVQAEVVDEPPATGGAPCGSIECEIPTPPKVTAQSYDPADVDWPGLIQTVKNICAFEPRFCTFAIRTAFHDMGSFTGGGAKAADASIIISDMETMLEDNTAAGFVPYARAILAHMGEFYGCSAADLLTVVAAYAPTGLGSPVDPSYDNRVTAPLYVGRIDHSRESSMADVREMHALLPGEFDAMPRFLAFWEETLSPHVVPPPGADSDSERSGTNYWGFVERDITALMGAHTLMDGLGCQERSCGGDKKMFLWDTDWYKDMNSGTCTPRKPPPLDGDNKPLNTDGGKGRTPDADERRAMRECSFKSAAGLELADNLQCQIDDLRGSAEDADQQAGLSFQFVDWKPTNSRSECCSDDPTCDPCTNGSDDWWCVGGEAGTVHWPYTWADCEMSFAIAEERRSTYCEKREGIQYAHEVDCSEMIEDATRALKVMSHAEFFQPMQVFEDDNPKWTHYYNKGFNKLSALGATWGNNPVRMFDLVIEQRALLPGDPMPVPDGLCAPLADIFAAAAAGGSSTSGLDVLEVSD